jgi:hypothetical protein
MAMTKEKNDAVSESMDILIKKGEIQYTMVSGTLGGKLTRRSHFVTAYLSRGFNLRLTGGA